MGPVERDLPVGKIDLGDRADRRAVTVGIADAAIAGDVAAGRIDLAGEGGKIGIDAAVDDGDLDALTGRAVLIGGQRVVRGGAVRAPRYALQSS